MRLALYEPDIPQNAGALIRLGACLGVGVDVIEPCGFAFTDRGLRRVAMDYRELADLVRHSSWESFLRQLPESRIVLLTTKADVAYTDVAYQADDILLLGRESAGVPEAVHARADLRVRIPLKATMRSINVAQAGAMVIGEALRQTRGFPL